MTDRLKGLDGPLLLTGATGRLGRAVVSMLPEDLDLRVLVLPGDPAASDMADHGARVYEADLTRDIDPLTAATTGVGSVVHMAAQLPRPGGTHRQLFDSIVAGTFNLLEAVVSDSPEARFVYVSSSAVYGPQLPPLVDPLTEEHPVRPTSVYGAAKASAEVMVQTYGRSHGLRGTVIRPSDIVVADDVLSPTGFVGSRFAMDVEQGVIRVPVDEAGRAATLSLASAYDIARGIRLALSSDQATGAAYHIGPIEAISDLEIARAVARKFGLAVEKATSTDGIRRWVLDSTKARTELGFEETWDIDDILEHG